MRPLTVLRVTLSAVPLDLTDPAVVADPYPAFARARAVAPVQRHEGLQLWLAFTHAEANAVLRDRRLGRIWRDKEPAERFGSFNLIHRNAILEMEPPEHTRLRRLISSAFARGHVERLRPWVEQLAGDLVDGLVERSGGSEPVDVLTGMAEQLPVDVIAELLGVPQADRPLLRPWSNAIVKMYEYGRTTAI
jgi:cytochrome P450